MSTKTPQKPNFELTSTKEAKLAEIRNKLDVVELIPIDFTSVMRNYSIEVLVNEYCRLYPHRVEYRINLIKMYREILEGAWNE